MLFAVLVATLLTGAIALPHALRLERATPAVAATIWASALVLRALTVTFALLAIVFFVPATALFTLITHWCWHGVVPLLSTHLPVDGHLVGGAAVVIPAALFAAPTLWAAWGLWQAARAVQRLLTRAVGGGPLASLVLPDREVLVAAAGLRRPRVVISAGALLLLDDDELAASLAHERGHIARRHRWVLVVGELCRALAAMLPGTSTAAGELAFHLERDADLFATSRQHDPVVLASALCKAAGGPAPLPPPTTALSGNDVLRRIALLIEEPNEPVRTPRPGLRALATAMCVLTLVGAASLPAAASTGLGQSAVSESRADCPT